ncbi:MAG: phosphonate-binding protein, partial [Caulobacterales bacterium]|nr:phosphonate-binding protein [Caulobacterales bacterium]
MKLSKLPGRSAVVAFSAEEVYAIAEYLRRRRGGAAVVMGALSPRTRNAQVELYQSGEVDYLVATDAIGMGLNMDVDHVAFASLTKFDGRRRRALRADEIAQIAGRAGRFRNDGTFGTTGECRPIPPDVVERVESHSFEAAREAWWRSPDLDFSSIADLLHSLSAPSPDPMLRRCREAVDEIALEAMAGDEEIAALAQGPGAVKRLWSACQLPDFRKATIDQHVRLIAHFARHLLSDRGRTPASWAGAEIAKLDNTTGDVDALAARLAHMRTWTYAASRSDWLDDPAHWRRRTREVEDRLSDALHERLTQRFVDRRTSALMRGLKIKSDFDVSVADSGEVTVEGHFLGRLTGLAFHPDARGGDLEARALNNAALRALRPEVDRRLGALARAEDEALALRDDLTIAWDGAVVAKLAPGPNELSPRARLVGGELGSSVTRARAESRLEAWLQSFIARDLAPLWGLAQAIRGGALAGLARGVAFQLVEGMGALARSGVAREITALSAAERRALRGYGVRIGEHVVFLPALVKPKPARLAALLLAAGPRGSGGRAYRPPSERTSVAAEAGRSPLACAAAGFWPCGPRAVRLDIVERLADLLRAARAQAGAGAGFPLSEAMATMLGCSRAELAG